MSGGGARGQNLEHLRFFFDFFSCRKLFVFEQQLLFRVDSLCDLGFSALGRGKHHVLLTRVDKPSLAQVRPYPTLVLPYPTPNSTLPHLPSPPFPSPPLPSPNPYPTLYPTLPHPMPCPALPYPTLPYPTLPKTLPYPPLAYPPLPYTLPYPNPTLPYTLPYHFK